MPSYYTPDLKITDTVISLSGEEHHHIHRVLRKKAGERLTLTNGKGILAEAEIIELSNRNADLKIIKSRKIKQSEPYLGLAFALLKNKHDSMIVEKCTELGCRAFFPVTTDYTVRKSSGNTIDKFKKTTIAAIKQCDNAWLPEVYECLPLIEAIRDIRAMGYEPVCALETEENIHLYDKEDITNLKGIALIIGPEGGFSESEKEMIKRENVFCFTLGNHILRAETAAIAGISLLAGINRQKNPHYY